MTSIATLEAVNTTSVPFNGQQVITAMNDGMAYVGMKAIVENLGMSWGTQQQKLMKNMDKFNCIHMNMVASDGKIREVLCIPLRKLNGWLFSINPAKVRADIRDRLITYQEECFTVLYNYWSNASKPKQRQCNTKQLAPLRQKVESLIGTGVGNIYPDIWKLIHKRFDIETISQLAPEQVPEAISYLDALEGELLPRQDKEVFTINSEQAMSICHLLCHVYWVEQRWHNGIGAGLKEMGSPLYGQTHEHVIHMARFGRILDRELAPMLKQFEHLSGKRLQQLQS